MFSTAPLFLPSALVDHYRIDLESPAIGPRSSKPGLGIDPRDLAVAPCGTMYALHAVSRIPERSERSPEPSGQTFGHLLLTRYAPDGTPSACVEVGPGQRADHLCVLPDGSLALSGVPDHTRLLSPDLSRVLASYSGRPSAGSHGPRAPDGEGGARGEPAPDAPFASTIQTTPAGRLLCGVDPRARGLSHYSPNLVALADGPLTVDGRPALRAIAAATEPLDLPDGRVREHIHFAGEPVTAGNHPAPELLERLLPNRLWRHHNHLRRPMVLAEDRFVVLLFADKYPGGRKGADHVYALLDGDGTVTGRLEPLAYPESPFQSENCNVATDTARGRAYQLNTSGLHAWSADGRLRAGLPTTSSRFSPLKQFTLLACSPEGDLLMAHRSQHLVLRIPAPEDIDRLGDTVEAALASYRRERTALKRAWSAVKWRWVLPTDPGPLPTV